MSEKQRALDLFSLGLACSQSVLAAFSQRFGMDEQTALKVARAFGGGLGLGQACGAVLGAFMVLGLAGGEAADGDNNARYESYTRSQEFARRFSQKHGSIICRDLLGLDLGKAEDYQKARDEDVFRKVCPAFVETACRILEEMLPGQGQAGR